MAGTIFGLPFDEELFLQMWNEVPDPTLTAILNSGAMVADSNIAGMIQNNGNLYTIPFYNPLDGDPSNHDGQTDITATEINGAYQTGVVYGRDKAFAARDFAAELSGGDPMGHIAGTVGRYWSKQRQKELIGILNGVFSITGSSGNAKLWQDNNTADLSSTTATPYTIGLTDANDLLTQAAGDNKSQFTLAIMHSQVAKTLENAQLLEFWTQTDANGITRRLNLATYGGMTVIIDDGVPATAVGGSEANKDLIKYTTYFLGGGALRQANARLDNPVETQRDPAKNGGMDILYTRIRETIHPNGFSFTPPSSSWTQSPTRAQLSAKANWSIVFNPKAIAMARLITNG